MKTDQAIQSHLLESQQAVTVLPLYLMPHLISEPKHGIWSWSLANMKITGGKVESVKITNYENIYEHELETKVRMCTLEPEGE